MTIHMHRYMDGAHLVIPTNPANTSPKILLTVQHMHAVFPWRADGHLQLIPQARQDQSRQGEREV